jgi:hypothetical protein
MAGELGALGKAKQLVGVDYSTPAAPTQQAEGTEAVAQGALADSSQAVNLMAPMTGAANFNKALGLPAPAASVVSAVALSAAAQKLDDSGVFSMMEITQLVFQANKQGRKIQRQDMMSALDAQAKLTANVADNMRKAAGIRFAAAVASSVVSMVGSFGQIKQAANPAKADAIGRATGAVSGLITATGEFKATELEAQNKLLEAAISRQEKVYQEAASMMGDMRENLQIARDTIKALAESQAMGRIAGNF